MAELTKQDVKEAVGEALEDKFPALFEKTFEPFATAVQSDITEIKKDVKDLRTEMKSEFAGVTQRLSSVEADVKWMKDNSSELFAKLDEFITLYKDQKTEFASLSNQVGRLEKRVADLESKVKS